MYHIKPIKPSLARIPTTSGYRRNVFTGWKEIDESKISGYGFSVKFECYGEAAIEPQCDALNGWYTRWTAWRATYISHYNVIQVTTHRLDVIDHLFEVIANVGLDSDPEFAEEELVEWYFQRIAAKGGK